MGKEEYIKKWLMQEQQCNQCALRAEGNRGPTCFTGSIYSPLMIVGEGPGGVEDIYGVPLVGPSGKLLDKALWSVGVTRDKVYVTNIVKCRPKGNRTPTLMEGRFCAERQLRKEIEIVRPAVIVALGKVALQYFKGDEARITKERGKWFEWQGIPIMPTYHPAFLLRQLGKDLVEAKWNVFYDLQAAVQKAVEINPSYVFKSQSMPDLLGMHKALKDKREI